MAGHSKWANIQHRKGAQDKKRAKIFTRLIREVTVAARMGGGADPSFNPRLRLAIDKANGSNMPKDTLERAIRRGAGLEEGQQFEEIRYEGYGQGGVAVMVDCMTDNRTRTVAEVRHAFSKCGGNLGENGSVAFQFAQKGVISFAPGQDSERIFEVALEAGAEDLVNYDDGAVDVLTEAQQFDAVQVALEAAGLQADEAEVTMWAANRSAVAGEQAEAVHKLLDMLDDLDDVQSVYHNAEFGD